VIAVTALVLLTVRAIGFVATAYRHHSKSADDRSHKTSADAAVRIVRPAAGAGLPDGQVIRVPGPAVELLRNDPMVPP
jgi:hypothetical protein